MDACIKADNANLALAICADMKRAGLEPDAVVYTMLVQALGMKGQVASACLRTRALVF